ncbi:MAG: AAA family ATPase [Lewinellaceae bacterium]|nr:AAA family ATPase [Saprospiraceae bacterium]MCB9342543.1 AAA family ATPase [Lewinellaceae bacterium]
MEFGTPQTQPPLEPQEQKPWKFKELRVYSSTEWLADNKKKYRQVFDRLATSYIYAELSFQNKQYDLDDWEINVELKCFSAKKQRKEICSLPFQRKVSKYDPVGYIREGWGNKQEGVFWKKGTYFWEAWIEGEKVATKYFHIEDAGRPALRGDNPYCQISSLRMYEGPYDDIPEFDRVYIKRFSGEETRYVYAEIVLKNLLVSKLWQCELFIKFYNNARELKGQVVRLHKVEKGEEGLKITAGWGSNVKGSWRHDLYSAEIVFMDQLMAVATFEVGDYLEEGTNPVWLPDKGAQVLLEPEVEDTHTFEEVLSKLDALIGLSEIKAKVREHAQYIQFLQIRKERGFVEKDGINVHSVFIGNPGTGKTTVAKMMGRLYKKMGLLTKGHVHEVDRTDLVGEYIGQTAPKVKDAIEMARGGVLFIDEAYSLARSAEDSKDFGREVIEILVKELSNGPGDLAVIVAGYPKEMKTFLDSNPGLRSRFKLTFEFADYLPQELSLIADYACHEKEVALSPDAKYLVDELITEAFRSRDRSFGNARFVHDLVDKAKVQLGLRVMSTPELKSLTPENLTLILKEDVEKVDVTSKRSLPNIPVDEKLLKKTLQELDSLIGLHSIKRDIKELVDLVRFYRESSRDVLGRFYLHTVFVGNPGTGKTTVARILTKIYKALGVLERGHMVETDRQGLVAGYVGQTAIKTAEKIDEAIGGVLFIDEAYALTSAASRGSHGDFGDEAIQTLLKRMEDRRGEFFVFVAGYPDNMDSFLKANPGLGSRFDKALRFDDYTPEELLEISLYMFSEEKYRVEEDAKEHLGQYMAFLHQFRDKYFGNARTVRQVVTEAIKNQNLRLSAKKIKDEQQTQSITLDDVASFTFEKDKLNLFSRRSIGFGK